MPVKICPLTREPALAALCPWDSSPRGTCADFLGCERDRRDRRRAQGRRPSPRRRRPGKDAALGLDHHGADHRHLSYGRLPASSSFENRLAALALECGPGGPEDRHLERQLSQACGNGCSPGSPGTLTSSVCRSSRPRRRLPRRGPRRGLACRAARTEDLQRRRDPGAYRTGGGRNRLRRRRRRKPGAPRRGHGRRLADRFRLRA
jgi:hypothetical protein